jgi:uncharacterized protein (TIGR03083 family)
VWRDESLARVPLVKSETERLSSLWRGFGEEEWNRETFCPGWTAAHAISHVTTGGDFYGNSIRRAIDGLPSEPPYGKDSKEFWAIRKVKGDELMALPRGEMMDIFDFSAAKLQIELERITDGDLDKLGYHPRGLNDIKAWIGMRLVELVVHDWDVRRGLDTDSRVTPQGVEGMIVFMPGFVVRLFNLRDKQPFAGRFHFRSAGPDLEWTLEVDGEKAAASPEISGEYQATIEADGEAHLLLPYGRLNRDEAEAEDRLRVEGDLSLADKLLEIVYTKY